MAYVDEARRTFDAAEFCITLTTAVGTGRTTTSLALRDTSAVSLAAAALQNFLTLAKDPSPPDVILAYVIYSEGASELFNALRAVSTEKSIASVALDCLAAIVMYSLDLRNPVQGLEGARGVVKEIVKARALLVYEVFVHDKLSVAKKALNLLRLVAHCHPVLAKELINRIDLGGEHMASDLCTTSNNFCRVPFLDLLFVLMACGDRDVVHALATKGRGVIVRCLQVIMEKTLNQVAGDKGREKKGLMPGHVQKRELIAAINFLMAIERHIITIPSVTVRQDALARPVLEYLVAIAASKLPSLDIAPEVVVSEQKALRQVAERLVVLIAGDTKVCRAFEAVSALSIVQVSSDTAALDFVLRIVDKVPRLSSTLLERGFYLVEVPRLESAWFAHAAVISACTLRLRQPITRFLKKRFFEQCLVHEDGLVRHTGVLILRAYCKVVSSNEEARIAPSAFLPRLQVIENLVKMECGTDGEAQRLLADYHRLLSHEVLKNKADALKLAVEIAGDDLVKTEDAFRAALATEKRKTIQSIFRKRYLSKLIIGARRANHVEASRRLWFLCRDIIKSCDLFPHGSEAEIDIFLAYFSVGSDEVEECVAEFERMLLQAWTLPFGLYDAIYTDVAPDKTSCLTAAAVIRLQNLKTRRKESGPLSNVDANFYSLLSKILSTVVACQGILGTETDGRYLRQELPDVLQPDAVWWGKSMGDRCPGEEDVTVGDCQMIQGLFVHPFRYPRTPYLQLIQALSLFRLQRLAQKTLPALEEEVYADFGTVWNVWSRFRQDGNRTGTLDLVRSFRVEKKNGLRRVDNESPLWLGMFMENLCGLQTRHFHGVKLSNTGDAFSHEEYVLSVASILRLTLNDSVRSYLATEAIRILSLAETEKSDILELLPRVQESLLVAMSCKHAWDVSQISTFVSFVLNVLGGGDDHSHLRSLIPFSFAFLVRLVKHVDVGTRILVQLELSKAADIELPPVQTFALSTAADVAAALSHFPSLQRCVVLQMSNWSSKDVALALPHLLPVFQFLLNPAAVFDWEIQTEHDFDEMRGFLLEEISKLTQPLLRKEMQGMGSIRNAVAEIGKLFLPSRKHFSLLLNLMMASRQSENGADFANLMLFLLDVIPDGGREFLRGEISDTILVELLTMMVKWFDQSRVNLSDPMHASALLVFQRFLKLSKMRKVALFTLVKDTTAFEKGLTSFCSNALKSVHGAFQCCREESENRDLNSSTGEKLSSTSISLPLRCVQGVLRLDLLLDKAAKRTLISMCAHEGSLLRSCLNCAPSSLSDTRVVEVPVLSSLVAEVAVAALKMLPRFGVEKEVALSLSVIEQVLSSTSAGFFASDRPCDIAVRDCMDSISQYMLVNQARSKHSLPDRRTGYFGAIKSYMLPKFEKHRLSATSAKVLRKMKPRNSDREVNFDPFTSSHSRGANAYDPVLVLRTFLVACAEALQAPRSAVMDIGRVAKDGLLSLVVTGIASDNQEIRELSYACLDLFSKIVGPISGVPLGSAAGLYKHRRELSFLLTLLQNSITEPMMKVVPLFAVWFRTCLRIALSPSHEAYKTVAYFFLRAPTLDVTDCLGVTFLMRHKEFQTVSQRRAARLLGLEIMKNGIVTVKDFNILRRRRLLDVLFMYGGTALGDDPQIHSEVFKTFSAILSRDDGSLSDELINAQGMVMWLLPLSTEMGESESMLNCRIDLLHQLAMTASRTTKPEEFSLQFSAALNGLLLRLTFKSSAHEPRNGSNLFRKVASCCTAIVNLAPQVRSLIDTNLCALSPNSSFLQKSAGFPNLYLARLIARQEEMVVAPMYYTFLLESTFPDSLAGHSFSSRKVLERSNALDVCMAHAFIADGLLFRQTWKLKEELEFELYFALAKAMYVCPTVWLTIACFSALQMKGRLCRELTVFADRLPGLIPDRINLAKEARFCSVVDEIRPILVDQLNACALLMRNTSKEEDVTTV